MSTDTHLPAPMAGTTTLSTYPISEELRRYDEHLRDVHGLSPSTRSGYLRVAGRLLRQHIGNSGVDIAKLHPADIRQFLADELDRHRTPSHASRLAVRLRSYLRYRIVV